MIIYTHILLYTPALVCNLCEGYKALPCQFFPFAIYWMLVVGVTPKIGVAKEGRIRLCVVRYSFNRLKNSAAFFYFKYDEGFGLVAFVNKYPNWRFFYERTKKCFNQSIACDVVRDLFVRLYRL